MTTTRKRVEQKRCCDLCKLPIFLYPGEHPGTCKDCEEKLTYRNEVYDDPCPECERVWAYYEWCRNCNSRCCEACRKNEHIENCSYEDDYYDDD